MDWQADGRQRLEEKFGKPFAEVQADRELGRTVREKCLTLLAYEIKGGLTENPHFSDVKGPYMFPTQWYTMGFTLVLATSGEEIHIGVNPVVDTWEEREEKE